MPASAGGMLGVRGKKDADAVPATAAAKAYQMLNELAGQHYRGRGDTWTAARDRAARRAGLELSYAKRIWDRWREMTDVSGEALLKLQAASVTVCKHRDEMMREHPSEMLKAPIDFGEKLATFSAFWAPHVVADYNGNEVFVVKMQGAFNWHSHPDTDDFFLVLEGRLRIEMRDGDVVLEAGQMFVVPRGVEHRPVAETDEVHALLIEPAGTPNTGDPATAAVKHRI